MAYVSMLEHAIHFCSYLLRAFKMAEFGTIPLSSRQIAAMLTHQELYPHELLNPEPHIVLLEHRILQDGSAFWQSVEGGTTSKDGFAEVAKASLDSYSELCESHILDILLISNDHDLQSVRRNLRHQAVYSSFVNGCSPSEKSRKS